MKFYHRIGRRNNWLATRLLVGAGYAYGNSEVMPYSEQFYIGGANSIRRLHHRSLGRAALPPARGRPQRLPRPDGRLQTGSQHRIPLRHHGAAPAEPSSLDARAIWLLKKDPKRPGAELKWKGFLNDIALGNGLRTALRHQLPGHPRRPRHRPAHPYPNPDKKGYYNISSFKDGLSDSTWPSGVRSKRPLRQGRTPAAIPAPKASGRAPPFGVRIRPFDPFRSAEIAAVTSPFAEIPFAIPGGMPHRCRTCAMPLRPRTAAVPTNRSRPDICAYHSDHPVRNAAERPGYPAIPASIKCTEKTACSCHIIPNLREYNFQYENKPKG